MREVFYNSLSFINKLHATITPQKHAKLRYRLIYLLEQLSDIYLKGNNFISQNIRNGLNLSSHIFKQNYT